MPGSERDRSGLQNGLCIVQTLQTYVTASSITQTREQIPSFICLEQLWGEELPMVFSRL